MERSRMMKVLCPVEGKNKKTYWMRVGNAYPNKDGSMNVYLNAYPMNGKLQIRDLDEADLQRSQRGDGGGGELPLGRPMFDEPPMPREDLPF